MREVRIASRTILVFGLFDSRLAVAHPSSLVNVRKQFVDGTADALDILFAEAEKAWQIEA
jgi:hypothetical protein